MSYAAEKSVIEQYIVDNYTSTLIKFENDVMIEDVSEWVRISIQNASAKQVSLGSNPMFRYVGILFIQVFIKPDIGSGRALQIADEFTNLFRAKRINGILFLVPEIQRIGISGDWYQTNVSVQFSREE